MIKDIPVSLLENLSFEEVENGQKVTISIPNETFAQIFEDMIDTLTESYGSDMDVIISNAVVSIVISDGYILSYNMEFDMEMDMDMGGITAEATAHVVSATTITNPGQAVTIVPPQDYESYPEL